MASTLSKKRPRRAVQTNRDRRAERDKQPRRRVPQPSGEQDWLARAREARAQTPLSADSTELLRELRAAGAQ